MILDHLNHHVNEVHNTARTKGWWDRPRTRGDILMLCVSEVAEATECVRNGEPSLHFGKVTDFQIEKGQVRLDQIIESTVNMSRFFKSSTDEYTKPEGESVELMDCQIRIMDYFGYMGWNLEREIDTVINRIGELTEHEIYHDTVLETHLSVVRSLALGASYGHPEQESDAAFSMACAFFKCSLIFEKNRWDWANVFKAKFSYNTGRPYRHGGKLV